MGLLKKIKIIAALLLAFVVAGLVAALKSAQRRAETAEKTLDGIKQGQKASGNVRQALDYAEEKKKKEIFKPHKDKSDFEEQW